MGDHTRCSFCTLRRLRDWGAAEGFTVETEPSDFGTAALAVYPDGRREKLADFMELADACAC